MRIRRAPGFVLTGRHVLAAIVCFFALIIGLDVWFTVLAYRSFPGETAANPYEAGLAYQQTLEKRARAAALGWQVAVTQMLDGAVELSITAADGTTLSGLEVSGALSRPATEHGRQPLAFVETSASRYRSPPTERHGAWDLTVIARDGHGDQFEFSRRLQWP